MPTDTDVAHTYKHGIGEHTMAGSPLLPTRETPSTMTRISPFENTHFLGHHTIQEYHGASSKSVTRNVKKKRKVY